MIITYFSLTLQSVGTFLVKWLSRVAHFQTLTCSPRLLLYCCSAFLQFLGGVGHNSVKPADGERKNIRDLWGVGVGGGAFFKGRDQEVKSSLLPILDWP